MGGRNGRLVFEELEMALTPIRWIAIALAGFLLVPVVILGDVEIPQWRPTERDRLIELPAYAFGGKPFNLCIGGQDPPRPR